jgi:uncharacterized membrane protein
LLVALAPSLALAGTINWDLAAVTCCVLALLAWGRDRPALAGALIGLGTAIKLYPVLLLGAVFALGLRQRRMSPGLRAVGAAALAWTAVNLPIALRYPAGWLEFWRFNADRHADYGSIWQAFDLLGLRIGAVDTLATGLFLGLCGGVVYLAWRADRTPTAEQLSFLIVAAFVVTNKVYSPQYVLWLLPLVVLARGQLPLRRVLPAFVVWQVAEMVYWLAIWRHFTHLPPGAAWQYPVSILVRIAVTVGLCAIVIADCLRADPDHGSDGEGTAGGTTTVPSRFPAARMLSQ